MNIHGILTAVSLHIVGVYMFTHVSSDGCQMYRSIVSAGEGKWLGISLLLCLCSALSKEQGITVVAVILAYDYLVMQRVSSHI